VKPVQEWDASQEIVPLYFFPFFCGFFAFIDIRDLLERQG
jgi:hypothetical protein